MVRALLLFFLLIQVSCDGKVARDLMVVIQVVAVVVGLGIVALAPLSFLAHPFLLNNSALDPKQCCPR